MRGEWTIKLKGVLVSFIQAVSVIVRIWGIKNEMKESEKTIIGDIILMYLLKWELVSHNVWIINNCACPRCCLFILASEMNFLYSPRKLNVQEPNSYGKVKLLHSEWRCKSKPNAHHGKYLRSATAVFFNVGLCFLG